MAERTARRSIIYRSRNHGGAVVLRPRPIPILPPGRHRRTLDGDTKPGHLSTAIDALVNGSRQPGAPQQPAGTALCGKVSHWADGTAR